MVKPQKKKYIPVSRWLLHESLAALIILASKPASDMKWKLPFTDQQLWQIVHSTTTKDHESMKYIIVVAQIEIAV